MFKVKLPKILPAKYQPQTIIPMDTFGERFLLSKFARPYRYKNRKARTNDRSGNKKKIHQYL